MDENYKLSPTLNSFRVRLNNNNNNFSAFILFLLYIRFIIIIMG